MSLKALSDYTFYSRYSHYIKEKKRRETWDEAVKRLFDMHREKYKVILEGPNGKELAELIDRAEEAQRKKRILSAQRALQFGGKWILKHECKIYNCCATHVDRIDAFAEIMYALLCGTGVGFSVQYQHINELPALVAEASRNIEGNKITFTIEDSIEGWADAIGAIMASYLGGPSKFEQFVGKYIEFDYSLIRPEGSLIAGQFRAPGPEGLKKSIEKIRNVFNKRIASGEQKLRPIDAYDIIMHVSDAVLSGGVRRSATICVFSPEDEEMARAKTGTWYITNPQRARSNNSVALIKDQVTREQFHKQILNTREYGEPGFVFLDDPDIIYNPCVEIALYPKTADGRTGFEMCNLTEINGRWCETKEKFFEACEMAAIAGTLQAGYTNFKYFGPATKEIVEREALLGCSITGMMDNPEILFDPEIQREGAEIIKKTNEKVAKLIGINPAARTTCVKPSGSASCLLSSGSGIHPHHARRYIRRVQSNRNEHCLKVFKKYNPLAVEPSVWSANNTDDVISFICEVSPGAIVKNQLSAVEMLSRVLLTQQNWIEAGTRVEKCVRPYIRHNVSNTCVVKDEEWESVEEFIYTNRHYFAGISLLPASGDLDYDQAPFTTVLTPQEMLREYGDAFVFASGLIVDGVKAFDGSLWKACACALGVGEVIPPLPEPPQYPTIRDNKQLAEYFLRKEEYDRIYYKKDWIRRFNQFADRYFGGNKRKCSYCLKHVSIWKTWCDLKREYKDIDWEKEIEEDASLHNVDEFAAQACAGATCEIL